MKKEALLNILNKEQDRKGYISQKAMKRISKKHNIPISRLYGLVTFYTMLRTEPQGRYIIELCGSPSCTLNNGRKIEKTITKILGIDIGETTPDKKFSVYKTSCIGCCDKAPSMLINKKPYTDLTPEKTRKILENLK